MRQEHKKSAILVVSAVRPVILGVESKERENSTELTRSSVAGMSETAGNEKMRDETNERL